MLEKEDEGARQSIQTMVKYLEQHFLNLGAFAVIVEVIAIVATRLTTIAVRVATIVLILLAIVIACRPPLGDAGVTPEDQVKRHKFFRIFGDHVIDAFDFDLV